VRDATPRRANPTTTSASATPSTPDPQPQEGGRGVGREPAVPEREQGADRHDGAHGEAHRKPYDAV